MFNLDLQKDASVAQKFQNLDFAKSFQRRPRGGIEESQFQELISCFLRLFYHLPATVDYLKDLVSNKQSGNPTFSLHKEIALPKVILEIHDSKGCTFLSEELLDIDSFNDTHPYFDDDPLSGNPTPSDDPIVSTTSPTLTPFGDSDFLLFEEADAFLGLEDDPDSPELDPSYYDPERDILSLEAILNTVQNQRRVNPKIHDVIKKEVEKLPDAGLIYSISDSPWVSPVHCVPKKGGITVVINKENELISTRLVTAWRVCIDYRKLNEATRKDHFPLPFMDQMLERLAWNEYYYFLDGFSGYFQIPIDPRDQEKTTFTCPYGTFAYRRMPFGLCNAPGTFQRCMLAIFHDMVEKMMEVFMDDFSVFGNSFKNCLSRLD
nr:reverse transcriptase domain-containing protein [Tanacetum cinerariifolium]